MPACRAGAVARAIWFENSVLRNLLPSRYSRKDFRQHSLRGTIASMARVLVVANWKMTPPTFREAKKLLEATKKEVRKAKGILIVVAPPGVFLRALACPPKPRRRRAKGERGVAFAVQRASGEEGGAYTGEISMRQAKDAGASFAIIGHSETRAACETDNNIRKQVVGALIAKMTPILCVGEKERRASGDYFNVVSEQLRVGLPDVSAAKPSPV